MFWVFFEPKSFEQLSGRLGFIFGKENSVYAWLKSLADSDGVVVTKETTDFLGKSFHERMETLDEMYSVMMIQSSKYGDEDKSDKIRAEVMVAFDELTAAEKAVLGVHFFAKYYDKVYDMLVTAADILDARVDAGDEKDVVWAKNARAALGDVCREFKEHIDRRAIGMQLMKILEGDGYSTYDKTVFENLGGLETTLDAWF